MTLHLPLDWQLVDLWKFIKWVILIQIKFRQFLWVLWGKRKRWEKNPFWDFQADRLWPFNFHPEIFKFKYLRFYSSDWKTEVSSINLELEGRHGEKIILIFSVFHLWKSLWLFTSPEAEPWARDPGKFSKAWRRVGGKSILRQFFFQFQISCTK